MLCIEHGGGFRLFKKVRCRSAGRALARQDLSTNPPGWRDRLRPRRRPAERREHGNPRFS